MSVGMCIGVCIGMCIGICVCGNDMCISMYSSLSPMLSDQLPIEY